MLTNKPDYKLFNWQDEQSLQQFVQNHSIEEMEEELLQVEQAECPVINTFGPGLYIRTIHIPAGTFAIGGKQRYQHMNVFLQGKLLVWREDGSTKEISAPMVFTGEPGHKMGYILEDMVWLNVYATEETDVAELEKTFWKESDILKEHIRGTACKSLTSKDYIAGDEEITPMPYNSYKVCVHESPSHGKGVFVTASITEGDILGPVKIGDDLTPIGKYLRYSKKPNAEIKQFGNDLYLIALKSLSGYKGGQIGDEITTFKSWRL